jgi:hypothetical protein
MTLYKHVTSEAVVDSYQATHKVFEALLAEVRELSKKKPEATLSAGKVAIINRVLGDLLTFLKQEPEGKYLDPLDDQALPQVSDALLVMVQFDAALRAFYGRYFKHTLGDWFWITNERLTEWKAAGWIN